MAKNAERYVKKQAKRLHTTTKVFMALALVVGVLAGAVVCLQLSKKDTFILKGDKAISLDLDTTAQATPFLYTDEGVTAICLGRDVSDKLQVSTTLQRDSEGRYIIPLDKEGVYTITYTVDCFKFGENAPNGTIKRVRTFTVTATEEDGRNE